MEGRVFTQTFGVVGAIIQRDGKYLLIHEANGPAEGAWSHPAGWIDVGEDPITAAKREVKEESGFEFEPTHLLGAYSLHKNMKSGERHGIKLIFIGTVGDLMSPQADDSSGVGWYTKEEIKAMGPDVLRDVDIKRMVDDFEAGKRYPLDAVVHTTQTEGFL